MERVPADDLPTCSRCQRALTFVASWTFRGLWGYEEVRTYECPEHGPVFINPPTRLGHGSESRPDHPPDNGDRDSLISVPRKPTPTLNADAIEVPEPDSD
jgi:hypothetical protein